jgi:hypothetical protein
MQLLERVRVLRGRDLPRRHRFVVGPECDREAVTHIDARLHARLKGSHRAPGSCESLGKLDFELGRLTASMRDPGNDVARHQAQSEVAPGVENDCIIDSQTKR